MLRSTFILIYMALYFVISTGVLFSVHKCRGEVVSVRFYTSQAKSCCKKGCKKNGCCKNETHFFKVKEDQKLNPDPHIPEFNLDFSAGFDYPAPVFEREGSAYIPRSLPIRPPPILNAKTPIFIKIRVLLI